MFIELPGGGKADSAVDAEILFALEKRIARSGARSAASLLQISTDFPREEGEGEGERIL